MDNQNTSQPLASQTLAANNQQVSRWRLPLLIIAIVLIALMLWQWLDGRSRTDDLRQDFAKRLIDNDAEVHAANVMQRYRAQTRILIAGKERLAILPKRLVRVHA